MPRDDYDAAAAEATARAYDSEAEATGWRGPQIAFGMIGERVRPGQAVLDLGIGTGLAAEFFRATGAEVHGLDASKEMLDTCRWKGFERLTLHDLTVAPYPYPAKSFDHVICIGVLNFIPDPTPVFAETSRLLRNGGMFVFVTGDRGDSEPVELLVAPEHTGYDEPVTLYRHSPEQVHGRLDQWGFALQESVPFLAYQDHDRTSSMRVRCYAAQKI